MSISARKVIKPSTGFRPLKILIILLVLSGLLWIGSRPAQASNLGENIPLSIVANKHVLKLRVQVNIAPEIIKLLSRKRFKIICHKELTPGRHVYLRTLAKSLRKPCRTRDDH